MSGFRNKNTGVVVSVDDSKDSRFGLEWVRADQPEPAPVATEVRRAPGRPKKNV